MKCFLDIHDDGSGVSLAKGSTFITTGSSSHVSTITTVSSVGSSEACFRPSHLLQQLQDLSRVVWLSLSGNCTSSGQPDVWICFEMEVGKLLDLAAISRSRVSFISEVDLILVKICLGLKPFIYVVTVVVFPYNITGDPTTI